MPATGDRITKRKDGLFQGMYSAHTPDGPKRKYIYEREKKDVERKLAEAMGDAARGIVFDAEGATVAAYMERWLEDSARGDLGHRAYANYRLMIRRHISPALGRVKLERLTRSLGIRLSMHPGQFIQPGSPKPGVSERSLVELRYAACVFDLIGSPDSVIVLHMGGAYEDRAASTVRFLEAMRSETGVLRYLALENDERVWAVPEIVKTARSLGVPVIADAFHHGLNPGGLTLKEALDLSLPTWDVRRTRPKVHLSSQDPEKQVGAHAYSVDLRDWYALLDALDGREVDVMVEAKGKEQALVPLGVRIW